MATGANVPSEGTAQEVVMDLSIVKDTLEKKVSDYTRLGFSLADAMHNAVCELLAGAEGRLSPAGMFCLRAWLAGARNELKGAHGRPEFN
jgi:hypothetical protein